jgi:formylglycine-generating enzyme required for sulfatase activity
LAPNAWGLFDTSGNADEWVNDRFTGLGYGSSPQTDPHPTLDLTDAQVLRGGPFNGWTAALRSADRFEVDRFAHGPSTGLRLVRTQKP